MKKVLIVCFSLFVAGAFTACSSGGGEENGSDPSISEKIEEQADKASEKLDEAAEKFEEKMEDIEAKAEDLEKKIDELLEDL